MRVIALSLALSCISLPVMGDPLNRLSPQSVADRLEGLLVYRGDEVEIHMNSCRVNWRSASLAADDSSVYLYQEQARRDRLDQPYRQRLLKISAASAEAVISDSFRLTEPDDWVRLCQLPDHRHTFTEADILPAHCRVTLTQKGRKFIGTTPEPGCPSQYRGATYVRNRIILTPTGMKTFDQGIDAQGNQVWGANTKPYRFRKQSLLK